jgi:toxin secretion/phage lysis holin|nr:MAG TPA: holin [Caudoviricetes sp.]
MNNLYETITTLWTSVELKLGAAAGILWGILSFAMGGLDAPLIALAYLMALDILTGLAAAFRTGVLGSKLGARGLFKKAGILLCVIVGNMIDTACGMDTFRSMLIAAFSIIEALSITENLDRMGYGHIIPSFLRKSLKQLAKEKDIRKKDRQ